MRCSARSHSSLESDRIASTRSVSPSSSVLGGGGGADAIDSTIGGSGGSAGSGDSGDSLSRRDGSAAAASPSIARFSAPAFSGSTSTSSNPLAPFLRRACSSSQDATRISRTDGSMRRNASTAVRDEPCTSADGITTASTGRAAVASMTSPTASKRFSATTAPGKSTRSCRPTTTTRPRADRAGVLDVVIGPGPYRGGPGRPCRECPCPIASRSRRR